MALVGYPDSSDDEVGEAAIEEAPPTKKRKVVDKQKTLPPLPSSFRDLYSSTVRTSTQDDPALHGGRKRVTPHVEGNWPTHVYLEWNPIPDEYKSLSSCVEVESVRANGGSEQAHSLLQNDLGVSLPLHVSLSRPLVLKTEEKEPFLEQLKQNITKSAVRSFAAKPTALRWYPNETSTRWFLVLQLGRPPGDELVKLLDTCNSVASSFDQPLLYASDHHSAHTLEHAGSKDEGGHFHISVAWSLQPQTTPDMGSAMTTAQEPVLSYDHDAATSSYAELEVAFAEIKVRVGQDVESIPLPNIRNGK